MKAARLTGLRLVGFKSFAERTTVEFGPGISAVVGPNGSGKSNLADALRWTLGEQGRSLRTRRAEDVIFAGSSSRRAVGMADVTLVIDNQDRLLPVDYGEVEIGRRLYRSGENEYLVNRQRIRLRDLVELLDAGNLADNAFLFIGQGMVDQALALRPEERRPLFEEAAGVRRHERRRRHAEAELSEAEANLERLRDLLGELRPQARRLAAQAEQLEARRNAGLELAEALLAAARVRWMAAAETETREARSLEKARAEADTALADLHRAEEAAASTSAQIATHAEQERSRREVVERHRLQIVELRIAQARLESELAGVDGEIELVAAEREATETRLREGARASALPRPQPDPSVSAEMQLVERALVALAATAGDHGTAGPVDAAEASAGGERGRGLDTRRSEHAAQAQRLAEVTAALDAARAELARLEQRQGAADDERSSASAVLADAVRREEAAEASVAAARDTSRAAALSLRDLAERRADAEAEQATARGRLAALDAALEAAVDEGLARAARARGGWLVAEGVEVEHRFQRAVSAALADVERAFVVHDVAPLAAAGRRGTLVIDTPAGGARGAVPRSIRADALSAVRELGGGLLADQLLRDPYGHVTRLLGRVVWMADLAAALRVAPMLAPGWRAVTIAGEVVSDEGIVRLAADVSLIELRAERDEVARTVAVLDRRLASATDAHTRQQRAVESADSALTDALSATDTARRERRSAEEAERLAQRRAEQWLREVAWQRTQVDRLEQEADSARRLAAALEAGVRELEDAAVTVDRDGNAAEAAARAGDLRARLDELRSRAAADRARLDAWDEERRRAEVLRAMDESRLIELDARHGRSMERRTVIAGEAERLAVALASAQQREKGALAELEVVVTAGADDRSRLIQAERAATGARERLRVAELATRRSEVSAMEARLQLEQLREQLLIELAAIGADGLRALREAAGESQTDVDDPDTDAFEAALQRAVDHWHALAEAPEPPSVARIASLRRRYHDLGAGNPFAAQEYAELRDRLETMEAQRADLESAIDSTRELIASLNTLITGQFRRTFAALEDAFARRFRELFGGGDAQLSLTAPDDLSSTGVEIHARPPGKKRQPLSMLSGGERALTAVSLLLAMLEVRPVPFCVLDEVDAALDEANIGRFSKALRGLAEQTQFIVITHNRGTIEAADTLYGVTLGDDAVSRIVSLRLPDAASNGAAPDELVADAEVALA